MRLREADVVFVIDEDVGPSIGAGITAAGGRILLLTDVVPRGTPDVQWVPRASTWGAAIVTRDVSMRRRPQETAALVSSQCHVFVLRCHGMKLEAAAELLSAHTPKMIRYVIKYSVPFLAHVNANGVDIKVGGPTRAGERKS